MISKKLGKQIRRFRLALGWKQEYLAELTGLSSSYIGMLERGEKLPSMETFIDLANKLGVSSDDLLADNLNSGYKIKISRYTEQIGALDSADQKRIFDVLDTLLKNF